MGACGSSSGRPTEEVLRDDFVVDMVIGKGSFGTVLLCRNRKQRGEDLVMKRIKKSACMAHRSHMKALWQEREVLIRVSSPFLLHMVYAFQTSTELFYVLPFMHGGDLMYHYEWMDTQYDKKIPVNIIRFYAAEIAMGLEDMHAMKCVMRDLKPENVLVDKQGHIRLCDFGLSVFLKKENNYKTTGAAGTTNYIAPEVAGRHRYNCGADFYSYGMVLIWMFEGHADTRRYYLRTQAHKHTTIPDPGRDLVDGLLVPNPKRRIGCGSTGWDEIKQHPFFEGIDWDAMRTKSVPVPCVPDEPTWINRPHIRNPPEDPSENKVITAEDQEQFEGFEWEPSSRSNTSALRPPKRGANSRTSSSAAPEKAPGTNRPSTISVAGPNKPAQKHFTSGKGELPRSPTPAILDTPTIAKLVNPKVPNLNNKAGRSPAPAVINPSPMPSPLPAYYQESSSSAENSPVSQTLTPRGLNIAPPASSNGARKPGAQRSRLKSTTSTQSSNKVRSGPFALLPPSKFGGAGGDGAGAGPAPSKRQLDKVRELEKARQQKREKQTLSQLSGGSASAARLSPLAQIGSQKPPSKLPPLGGI